MEDQKVYTFYFDGGHAKNMQKLSKVTRIRKKIWQIFPSVCSCLLAIPFGLQIGWASPIYPQLLTPTAEVPITLGHSAMIGGALMLGNIIATPFSTSLVLPPRSGIVLGSTLITISWAVMWYATNLYWILGSRLLAGIGYGYGVGQARRYISDICATDLKPTLLKTVNVYQFLGIVAGNALGYVDFRTFSVVALGVSVIVLFVCMVLPSTPKELVKHDKLRDARRLMQFLYGRSVNYVEEIQNIKFELAKKQNVKSLANVIRTKEVRKPFVVFVVITMLQPLAGGPTTLVYNELIFRYSNSVTPHFCAIVYTLIFFLVSVAGIFYFVQFNKKHVLLTSSILTTISLGAIILILYFNTSIMYFQYIFPISMFLYKVVYTFGMGSVPITLINVYFPANCRQRLILFFIMMQCACVIVVTKLFQMLITIYPLYVGFCIFLCVSLVGNFFILFVMPNDAVADDLIKEAKIVNDNKNEEKT